MSVAFLPVQIEWWATMASESTISEMPDDSRNSIHRVAELQPEVPGTAVRIPQMPKGRQLSGRVAGVPRTAVVTSPMSLRMSLTCCIGRDVLFFPFVNLNYV